MSQEVSTIRAVVRFLEGGEAIVEVEQGGCGRCQEKGGCGGQHLTQMMCSGPKTYRVDNLTGAAVGDQVTVAIAAGAVSRSANLAYGIPVVSLVLGAGLGSWVGGDFGAMAGAVLGLTLAWGFARVRVVSGAGNQNIRPYIVNRP